MARFENLNVNRLHANTIVGPASLLDFPTRGKKIFVHSGIGSDTVGMGESMDKPKASIFGIAGALSKCNDAYGDLIVVLAGHAETLTSEGAVAKSGVTVLCMGNGNNRPAFTINAAIPGFNVTDADVKVYNARILAGSLVTAATRLLRIAANRVHFIHCRFEMAYDMYHMIVVMSGDAVILEECEYVNTVTMAASVHPQTAVLNIGGTDTQIKGGRFMDTGANKAERWRACAEGGKLTAKLTIEKALFICRGIATRTRSAGASGLQFTIDCRGISPSSNTAVGAIFTPNYQYLIETYNVAAVNKVAALTVTGA